MKQIKPILTTILLLLLLSSISYGWVPPPINSPVLLDETDADPWGETISCHNYDKAVSGINPGKSKLELLPKAEILRNIAIMTARLILSRDITLVIYIGTVSLDDERNNNRQP